MTDETIDFKPPYMSFLTLWNFLAELSAKPLPPKLDRSIMSSKSGTDQNNLMSALEAFGFLDEGGVVLEDLQRFAAADADGRKEILRTLLEVYYAPALEVSNQNGTPNDLKAVFRDKFAISASDTQRKSITFFLHAAREAGLELSPHFPKTRAGSGAPGAPKAKKATPRKKAEATDPPDTSKRASTSGGHTQTVHLKSGGTVTLAYDVNMFDVTDDDEQFVLGLIKTLRTYKSAHPSAGSENEGGAL